MKYAKYIQKIIIFLRGSKIKTNCIFYLLKQVLGGRSNLITSIRCIYSQHTRKAKSIPAPKDPRWRRPLSGSQGHVTFESTAKQWIGQQVKQPVDTGLAPMKIQPIHTKL